MLFLLLTFTESGESGWAHDADDEKTVSRMSCCVRFEERVKMQDSKGVFGAHSLQSGHRRGESNTQGDGELDVLIARALQRSRY